MLARRASRLRRKYTRARLARELHDLLTELEAQAARESDLAAGRKTSVPVSGHGQPMSGRARRKRGSNFDALDLGSWLRNGAQGERKRWEPVIESGYASCVRYGFPIVPSSGAPTGGR